MKVLFSKKSLILVVLIFISSFVFAKQNTFYIAIPEEIYFLISDKTIYKTSNEKINLITMESLGESIISIEDSVKNGEHKKNKPLLLIADITKKNNDFLKNFENKLENENSSDNENVFIKEKSIFFNKTVLYPCMPFSENMPLCGNAQEFILWKEKINFYKWEEIPAGYIAIPYTKEKRDSKLQADLRAMNAIYSNSEEYPFFEADSFNLHRLNPEFFISNQIKFDENIDFIEQWNNLTNIALSWFDNEFVQYLPVSEQSDTVSFISSVGDIMIAREVDTKLINEKKPDNVFNRTLDVLQHNDFTIGNLEGAVTDGTSKTIKSYTFKFKKKALPYLQDAGFDYFMLTNNHCYDYGEQGFKDTLKALDEYNIKTSGAGYNYEQASQFYNQKVNDMEIAVLSIGAFPQEQNGFNGKKQASATDKRAGILWKSDDIYDAVKKEKDAGRFIILNIHDGKEYTSAPYKEQREFYEKLCNSGADVIFGSHPHVLQPIEWYNNSLIVWSQGNFIFPGMGGMKGAEETMIVRIGVIKNRLIYYQKYPAKINNIKVDLK